MHKWQSMPGLEVLSGGGGSGTPGARDGSGGSSQPLVESRWAETLFLGFGQMEAAVHNCSRREVAADHDPLILFSILCSTAVISTAVSSSSLIHAYTSFILLLIPSVYFFISCILFFTSVWMLIFSFC